MAAPPQPVDHFSRKEAKIARRSSERPEWAGLVPELVSKIGDHLLACDAADYIRVRAVCKPWRRSTVDPRGLLHPRFFPRNWLMIHDDEVDSDSDEDMVAPPPPPVPRDDGTFRFVNVRTGATLRIRLPPAEEYGNVLTTGGAEGLLLLHCRRTDTVRLLNPLTSAMAVLPGLRNMAATTATRFPARFISAGVVFDGDSPERPTVLLMRAEMSNMTLLYAKPGDADGWGTVDISCVLGDPLGDHFFHGGLSFRGQFYASTRHGDLLKVVLAPQPHMVYVVRRHDPAACTCAMGCTSDLVPSLEDDADDNDGILLVRSSGYAEAKIFGVHVESGRFTPRLDLGNRAIFLPLDTLRADKFPKLVPGRVYKWNQHIQDFI